jgi:hypothetical protein
MKLLGSLNNRKIFYQGYSLDTDWSETMPVSNWLLLVAVDDLSLEKMQEIASKAIDKNVCYICTLGKQSQLMHDLCDEEIVSREVYREYLPPHFIMTTWDVNLDEGLLWAMHGTYNDEEKIEMVYCLDASDLDLKDKLMQLIEDEV